MGAILGNWLSPTVWLAHHKFCGKPECGCSTRAQAPHVGCLQVICREVHDGRCRYRSVRASLAPQRHDDNTAR
ncbi:TPA: hypothetical protein N0F65_004540 [Lagenidium giganteum]|uniref:Secreted protein n=1 Tax=Lagenidium giganteum TaxID=4803 RepID=A0AAV2ZCV8_9STRA|nr:TPA: hypothetical protein N0F65_004540 [Lagenidium giganteum]